MDAELLARCQPIARVIAQRLAVKPEHFITHPSERRLFQLLGESDLREFAQAHGWRFVRRLGGRRIEFYNDAHERQERVRTGNSRTEDERPDR